MDWTLGGQTLVNSDMQSDRGLKNMMYFIFDRHLDAKKADSINLHRFSVIWTETDLDFGSKVRTQTGKAAPSLNNLSLLSPWPHEPETSIGVDTC